ncbi:Indoleamine 2,3-dioxygenase [Xylaria digitata]|nr:Indoleamine 2,3-dioxygenase [Xylaria digitata]
MPSRISDFKIPQSEDILDLYSLISKNGFLPIKQPLEHLSDTYYQQWERIMTDIPTLIREKTIRNTIDKLEVLETTRLNTEREWQRAYVILCFLTHGYIWGGDMPSEILPPSITVPFLQVSNHLDLPPIATYAALNLWNFTSTGEDFTDLDSLKALHTFSGTEDESWFYVLSVAVEARGASIIPLMLQATDAIKHKDYGTVTHALSNMATCIRQLTQLLDRMSEKCDPMVFYHQIRPFLAGTKSMGAAGLPSGVFYDEGDGRGHWKQLRGGSNGQSSLIQFFDLILGIDHASTGNYKTPTESSKPAKPAPSEPSFHEEVRLYMPGPHRKFLTGVSQLDKIKDFVHSTPTSPAQQRLRQSYQDATEALGDFRQAHMQMVTRYIIVPSRKPAPSLSSGVNLATTSLQTNRGSGKELTGTGGTDLIPFLRTTRDDTYRAGLTVAHHEVSVIKPRILVGTTHKDLAS